MYWDKQEKRCKQKRLLGQRWKRQPLVSLSAPETYLAGIHLCEANLKEANLYKANLQQADLDYANLQQADLDLADLQQADLSEANLQKAKLGGADLQKTLLREANLQQVYLDEANLQETDLSEANLQQAYLWEAENLTPKQIKSACFWEQAIYKAKWNNEKQAWVAKEPDNTNFIEELKKDKSSDPGEAPDCRRWEKEN